MSNPSRGVDISRSISNNRIEELFDETGKLFSELIAYGESKENKE